MKMLWGVRDCFIVTLFHRLVKSLKQSISWDFKIAGVSIIQLYAER